VPYTVFDSLPLGVSQTRAFFERLAAILPLDKCRVSAFLDREEEEWQYLLASLSGAYYSAGLQRNAALVGDAALLARLEPFLAETLGVETVASVATDDETGAAGHDEITRRLREAGSEVLIGRARDAPAARELGLPHLTASAGGAGPVPLHKTYSGTRGAAFFVEDYAAAITSAP